MTNIPEAWVQCGQCGGAIQEDVAIDGWCPRCFNEFQKKNDERVQGIRDAAAEDRALKLARAGGFEQVAPLRRLEARGLDLLRGDADPYPAVSVAVMEDTPQTLQEHAVRIDALRRVNTWLKRQHDRALEEFKRSQAVLLAEMERNEQALDAAEEAARDAVLTAYKESGQKSPGYGFSVRVRRDVEYDPELVRSWAFANMPALLKLDEKQFDRAVLAGVAICPHADILETPQATIATDLSKYLATDETGAN